MCFCVCVLVSLHLHCLFNEASHVLSDPSGVEHLALHCGQTSAAVIRRTLNTQKHTRNTFPLKNAGQKVKRMILKNRFQAKKDLQERKRCVTAAGEENKDNFPIKPGSFSSDYPPCFYGKGNTAAITWAQTTRSNSGISSPPTESDEFLKAALFYRCTWPCGRVHWKNNFNLDSLPGKPLNRHQTYSEVYRDFQTSLTYFLRFISPPQFWVFLTLQQEVLRPARRGLLRHGVLFPRSGNPSVPEPSRPACELYLFLLFEVAVSESFSEVNKADLQGADKVRDQYETLNNHSFTCWGCGR